MIRFGLVDRLRERIMKTDTIRQNIVDNKKNNASPKLTDSTNKDSNFAKDVLLVTIGPALAQILALISTPIITRLYSPLALGTSSLFTSIIIILGVIVCLRYQEAIIIPYKDKDAANVFGISFILIVLFSLITSLIIFLNGASLISALNAYQLKGYLWLLPLAIFINGLSLILNRWYLRKKKFARISLNRIVCSSTTITITIIAGFIGYNLGVSLIVASIIGSLLATFILGLQIWHEYGSLLKESIDMQNLIMQFKKYKNFPLYDMWGILLNNISWQLPTFFLAKYFSPIVVGYYSLAMGALMLPMNLIGLSISSVFFQRSAKAKFESDVELTNLVETTFLRLGMVGIFPILLLVFIGKDIFSIIFGSNWSEAGIYVQILSFFIFFQFISESTITLFSTWGKQRSNLIFNIFLLAIRAVALALGGFFNDARIALIFFSASGIIAYSILSYWLLSGAKVPILKVIKEYGTYLSYCLPGLVMIALAKYIFLLRSEVLIVIGIISAVFYYFKALKHDGLLEIITLNAIRELEFIILRIFR